MKTRLFAPCIVLLLASCAGVHVKETTVASGATRPLAIYIRPFAIDQAVYGPYASEGDHPIRRSLAPAEFAEDLREEMAKMAPAMVLKDDEEPRKGWLVEGQFDEVWAGHPGLRVLPGPLGKSKVLIHVRISEIGGHAVAVDTKDVVAGHYGKRGHVIYEFDVEGGSNWTGHIGGVNAPGLGNSIPFDFRNAAERIMLTVSPDPYGYGVRSSSALQ